MRQDVARFQTPGLIVILSVGALLTAHAQPSPVSVPEQVLAALRTAEPAREPATLSFFNRDIVVLRARVLGRSPSERAAIAAHVLDGLAAQRLTAPVEAHSLQAGTVITIASRFVVAITDSDIDYLGGDTRETVGAAAVAQLRVALSEAEEARTASTLMRSTLLAVGLLILGGLALLALGRLRRFSIARLTEVARRTLERTDLAALAGIRVPQLLDFQRRIVSTVASIAGLATVYLTLTLILKLFPYTRPWGESLGGFILASAQRVLLGIVRAAPDLFMVALIVIVARIAARAVGFWCDAIEHGRTRVKWLYPETIRPTRRIFMALVWLFAAVMAYPYIPGSETDAFKGVSVFVGLLMTLGSSGLVNHIMSGFMLTYSRALRVGDFVRIGDVEGTVVQLGVLSTKIRTVRHEEVTIPNALVVSQTTTDYSRSHVDGVYMPTTVSIGYDVPWRQVRSLLLTAAGRTAGIRHEPAPQVLQTALEDFAVSYTLLVCPEHQELRPVLLNELHGHIQDIFNEFGVQIMTPTYEGDPDTPKLVAKQDWFAAPAQPESRRLSEPG
jgi:small-conductance mechanosensitive channel